MANLLYLLVAIAVTAVTLAVMYARTRKPKTMEWGIDSFQRELKALAPDRRGALPPPRETSDHATPDRESRRSG